MEDVKHRVENLNDLNNDPNITQENLESHGLSGATLRDYQLYGVNWLRSCYLRLGQGGCILGDEMGLGKTIQTLSFLMYIKEAEAVSGPSLILAPLSVIANWRSELERWIPSVKLLEYLGNIEKRQRHRNSILSLTNIDHCKWKHERNSFDVLLTSYEICLKDSSFLKRFKWDVLVVDEAHRLKNYKSLLYSNLSEFNISFKVLLTGTPVQNNLTEIYSLLSFICPDIFKLDNPQEFDQHFGNIVAGSSSDAAKELIFLLRPFVLRRKKDEVIADLPKKSEVVLFTGMSATQKQLYKAILSKDFAAFSSDMPQRFRLVNILMQLRKCCNHPYIFPGIEPEPFEIGDHLVVASGKLSVLDRLLIYLKASGHRVLIFSQFTTMLDILQDYLTFKGYTYERLDGSVRGEERYLAVNNFNESDATFVFLLSTRAGGQGLNLMTADTVIFIDNDFNPQNDLQAAARAHRIGQTRPVKIIRLVSKCTVEEIILRRATSKLKLTETILEAGQLSHSKTSTESTFELLDILKFGLNSLFNSDESTDEEQDFSSILGESIDGEWCLEDSIPKTAKTLDSAEGEERKDNMYLFEGHDYTKISSNEDKAVFDLLAAVSQGSIGSERSSRRSKSIGVLLDSLELPKKIRKELTAEEKDKRKKKRADVAAKKAKLFEDEEIRKAQETQIAREKLWNDNSYETMNISESEVYSDDSSDENEGDQDEANSGKADNQINYVVGDVLQPVNTGSNDAIIIHCVDNSGHWGKGGLFSAISARSSRPEIQYQLAGKMQDLTLGDAHLIPIDDKISRNTGHDMLALIVAQKRDMRNRIAPISLKALAKGLERVKKVAKRTKASIHLPRIGYNTINFNWYGTERIIRKLFTSRGISTSIYYFPRNRRIIPSSQPKEKRSDDMQSLAGKSAEDDTEMHPELLNIFSGMLFYFHGFQEEEKRSLSRYIIAYDGEIVNNIDKSTTYIIHKELRDQVSLPTLSSSTQHISVERLKRCISEGRLIDESEH